MTKTELENWQKHSIDDLTAMSRQIDMLINNIKCVIQYKKTPPFVLDTLNDALETFNKMQVLK